MNTRSTRSIRVSLRQRRLGAAFAAALLLAPALPASALTAAEIRCRDVASQLAREGAENTLSYRLGCIRRRFHNNLSLTVDCAADPAELGGPGTGDLYTDRRLAELAFLRQDAGVTLVASCNGKDVMAPDYIAPADVALDTACPGGSSDWTQVGACVVDQGIRSIDRIMEMFDLQIDGLASEPQQRCLIDIVSQIRRAFRTNARMRSLCYRDDDRAMAGGGAYNCGATVMPPGIVEVTGDARIDKQLGMPFPRLEGVIRRQCDLSIDALGFVGAVPDVTGGRFTGRITLDDVIHGLNDKIQEATNEVSFGSNGADGLFPQAARGGYCGDGTLDAGEQCDDGNNTSCDGCDRDCTLSTCGNGAVCGADGEECDDGNNVSGDGCSAACISERCMNGIVNPGYDEDCDDGVESFNCDTDCTFAYCGDGYNNAVRGEVCDDGVGAPLNTATCDSDCTAPHCPDGHFNPFNTVAPAPPTGEQCDDGGNSLHCDADCTPALCGDAYLNTTRGEACDDGNNANNDSCVSSDDVPRSNCQVAFCGDGFLCTNGTCTSGPTGGAETCDDGTGSAGSAESTTCDDDCSSVVCGDGNRNTTAGEACDAGPLLTGNSHACTASCRVAICGDANLCNTAGCTTGPSGGLEQCDDGNGINNDPCRNNCAVATCGDGVVCSALACTTGPGGNVEECDGGGQTALCDSDCSVATCGDSQVNAAAGETCDTGGNSATCDADCTAAACRDGFLNPAAGEQCDDGNNTNGDRCTNTCQVATCGDSIRCTNASCNTAGLGPEQCDTGGESLTCDSNCTTASCGDGDVNATRGEECDAAGASADCDADCTAAFCGDGTLNGLRGETCDDGDDNNNDRCPDNVTAGGTCHTATCGDGFLCTDVACTTGPTGHAEVCDNGGANSNATPDACRTNCAPAHCGDGVVDTGETCDNAGANSNVTPNACRTTCVPASCGDGVIDAGETCDNAGANSNVTPNACRTTCVPASCGDGVIDAGETCDNAGANSNVTPNACRTTCVAASCGDGVIDAGETCDNAGANSNVTPNACRTTCVPASCGDGVIDAGETCDQGGANGSGSGFCLGDCSGIQP